MGHLYSPSCLEKPSEKSHEGAKRLTISGTESKSSFRRHGAITSYGLPMSNEIPATSFFRFYFILAVNATVGTMRAAIRLRNGFPPVR